MNHINQKDIDLILGNPMILSVRGKIGDKVFVLRDGINFVREWVIPRDPKTFKQRKQRNYLTSLAAVWRNMGSDYRKSWKIFADKNCLSMSGYNVFIVVNMPRITQGKKFMLFKYYENTPEYLEYLKNRENFQSAGIKALVRIFVIPENFYMEKAGNRLLLTRGSPLTDIKPA